MLLTCTNAGNCNTQVSPALVNGTTTFYLWAANNGSSHTINNNDSLSISVSNLDSSVEVIGTDSQGLLPYGTQV